MGSIFGRRCFEKRIINRLKFHPLGCKFQSQKWSKVLWTNSANYRWSFAIPVTSWNPLNTFLECFELLCIPRLLFMRSSSLHIPLQPSKRVPKNPTSVWCPLVFQLLTWDVFQRQSTLASSLQLLKTLDDWRIHGTHVPRKKMPCCSPHQNCQKLREFNVGTWLTGNELIKTSLWPLSHSWPQNDALGWLHCPLPAGVLSSNLGRPCSTEAEYRVQVYKGMGTRLCVCLHRQEKDK